MSKSMRVLLLTQDEPFYLAENIDYLIKSFPEHSKVVGCCLFSASPFGKREGLLQKAKKTYQIFGVRFFLYYTWKYILGVVFKARRVEAALLKNGVPIFRLQFGINDSRSVEKLKPFDPDLLVSIAGNQIFKKPIIELASRGCINLHTSLLPKHRGLLPSFWVLKNGDKETGVSVFFVDEGIDSGPILVQKRIQIGDLTQQELIKRTKKMGMEAIVKAVNMINEGEYELIENDDNVMSYNSFPTREDVKAFLARGKRFF